MTQTNSMAILATVTGLLVAAVAEAQQAPPKNTPPIVVPAAKSAPSESASATPAAKEPARRQPAAGADLVEVLSKMRQEAKGDCLTVGDICQVKHYEQDTLQGFGLVLDLEEIASPAESDSGEEETPSATAARLTQLLALLNSPAGADDAPSAELERFRGAGQVTLVAVTATVPPEGVRAGDRIDCEVRALGGESLTDGYLFLTQLWAPGPRKDGPAALAAGPTVTQSSVRSGPAKVLGGCVAEADVGDQFVIDQKICLILNEEHADFPVAQDVVDLINAEMEVHEVAADQPLAARQPPAKALNRHNIEVAVPKQFADDPVAFVTKILRLETDVPAPDDRR